MNNYYITVGCENKSKTREESLERATEHNTLGRDNQERFPSKKKIRQGWSSGMKVCLEAAIFIFLVSTLVFLLFLLSD